MNDEQHKPWCSEQARELNGGCICKPSELAAPAGSVGEAYNAGWHDGLTAAANIFDKWYRNNCITAGATNAIELASRLFREANLIHDEQPNTEPGRGGPDATKP